MGTVTLRKETLVMVYVCEVTNLPFLVTLAKVREERPERVTNLSSVAYLYSWARFETKRGTPIDFL